MNEKIRILSTVGLYHALNDGTVAAIPILFPIFKLIFNLSYTQIGIITGGSLIVHIFSQLLLGRYSDGKNSRTLLSFGILLTSISMLLFTQINGFYSIILIMFLLRISESFFHPIGIGWISRIFKNHKLDWAMGIQSGLADIGAFIAIATTLYISEIINWKYPLYLWSIAGVIVLLIGTTLTSNIKEDYLLVNKISKRQTIKEAIDESLVFLKKIKLIIPAYIISGSSWGIIITYLPLYLTETTELSLTAIGLIVSVWIGIGSISSILYGRICRKFGRSRIIFLSYFTIGITSILITYFSNISLIILIIILMGITVFITFPAIIAYISEITHESVEGKTFGIIFTLQIIGSTFFLFFGGFLSDVFGIWIPFILLGVSSLIFSLILIIFRKRPIVNA
jgi:FSR family fosmidomycin resistance protein-like MFS transporter